jgi:hypothetical protein
MWWLYQVEGTEEEKPMKTGDVVEISLSDLGWVTGTITSFASPMEAVVHARNGYHVVSLDSGRIRHQSEPGYWRDANGVRRAD